MKRRRKTYNSEGRRLHLPCILFGAALAFFVIVIVEDLLLATPRSLRVSTEPTPIGLDTSRDLRTCSSKNGALVTIVLSARAHRKRRDAIRETWGKNHSVFFVVGESVDPAVDSTYDEEEIQKHDDLILTRALDNYRSLPSKLKFALKWLDQRCDEGVAWVLKLDDDMFARIGVIAGLVRDYLDPGSPVVVGHVLKDEVVKRFGKWIESSYQHPVYPLFAQGSCGYVVSRPIARYVTEQLNGKMNSTSTLRDYQGEDTSLGIWLDEQSELDIEWWDSLQFVNHGNCEDTTALSIGHKMTPEQMRRCYANKGNIDPVPSAPVRVDKLEKKVTKSEEYIVALQRHEGYLLAGERSALNDQRKLERERRRKILAGGE